MEFSAGQPVVSEDGTAFYLKGQYPTYLYAIDANTGLQRWKFAYGLDLGTIGEIQMTVDEMKERIYFVDGLWTGVRDTPGALWAVNIADGGVAWMMDKAHGYYDFKGHSVLLQSGKIYVMARVPGPAWPYVERDHVVRIDATSRDVEIVHERVPDLLDIKRYTVCNDRLVVGYTYPGTSTRVVGHDLLSASPVWTKSVGTSTGEFACNDNRNRVYVPTDPSLCALEAATGAQTWKYTALGAIHTPSIANGIIYFTSRTDMIAIDEKTRQQVFSYPMGQFSGEATQVAVANGMLYFTHGA